MKVRLSTMAAVMFLVAAGVWGAMTAMATETTGVTAVEPARETHVANSQSQARKLVRKVRGPQDKLDFVNYRRSWRTYHA